MNMDGINDALLQVLQKVRVMAEPSAVVGLAATSIIKDEEGQIKWSAVLTGGLTAGLIAASTSLFSMQQTLTERSGSAQFCNNQGI